MHKIYKEALELEDELIRLRRHFHKHPEIGMEVDNTAAYVKEELTKMGYEPKEIIKNGLVAIAGGKKPGKCVLLRADMDALPIKEDSDYDFKSINNNMHACGHDFHTAMLLGAARILKKHEDEIVGSVKIMFQPGEEIITGAKEMIDAGVLKNPCVDMALMIHLFPNLELKAGTVIIPHQGPTTLAADWFDIEIFGKGGHGAMPNTTVDPLNVAAHLHIALQSINSRETSPLETSIVTIGVMEGGTIGNVIPDKAVLKGTIRTFSKENRLFIHQRIKEIAIHTANTYRASAKVNITHGCPSITCDSKVVHELNLSLAKLLSPDQHIQMNQEFMGGKILFSEDFSYISEECPSAILLLSAGHRDEGYCYPLHHPKVKFDESILKTGAAVFAQSALHYLKEGDD